LRVWFDNDYLRPASSQKQLEDAIGPHAKAFAVYVGSRGIVNWVAAEVRLGLSRAILICAKLLAGVNLSKSTLS
jgi:hypothetical protein